DRRRSEHDRVLRGPVLVERRAAAPPLQRAIDRAREKRRHLETGHVRGRVVGRRRGPGRDPEVEDLQDEGTEGVGSDVGEWAADSQKGARDPAEQRGGAQKEMAEDTPGGQETPHKSSFVKEAMLLFAV